MKCPPSSAPELSQTVSDVIETLRVGPKQTSQRFEILEAQVKEDIKGYSPDNFDLVMKRAERVRLWPVDGEHVAARIVLLIMVAFYAQRIGKPDEGFPFAHESLRLSEGYDDGTAAFTGMQRRAYSVLATLHMDLMNFVESCGYMEKALRLAFKQGDPFLISVAYQNTAANLKEMGCYCYRDALKIIDKGLEWCGRCDQEDHRVKHLIFGMATNGLFCADRLEDETAAVGFISQGLRSQDSNLIDVVTRAAFEYSRISYLIRRGDFETAEMLVSTAHQRFKTKNGMNNRAWILLGCCQALCDVASQVPGRIERARENLADLYSASKKTNLYHDDVLRALVAVYGRSRERADLAAGMVFAKELVEYTTAVKRLVFTKTLVHAPTSEGVHHDQTALMVEAADELNAARRDVESMRSTALMESIRTPAYEMAENWALAAEIFDDHSGEHCFRVGRLASLLAAELGKSPEYCVRIEHAARLHDIGKITIDQRLITKAAPLTTPEMAEMRSHSQGGAHLLEGTQDDTLEMARLIALHHHEWWNGTGYPMKLRREEIPLEARIVALCDVYDALSTSRPYKRAWSHRITIEQIIAEMGTHFDPSMRSPFLRAILRYVSETASSSTRHRVAVEGNRLYAVRKRLMDAAIA